MLMTGYLSDPGFLVANTCLVNLFYLLYLYVYSVLQTCGPLIGNKIGERRPETAKKIISSVLKFGFMYSFACIIIIFTLRYWLYRVYTNNESIISKMYTNRFKISLQS